MTSRARCALDPLDVRRANFYGVAERNVTHYGQTLEDNLIHEIVTRLEREQRLSRASHAHRGVESPPIRSSSAAWH